MRNDFRARLSRPLRAVSLLAALALTGTGCPADDGDSDTEDSSAGSTSAAGTTTGASAATDPTTGMSAGSTGGVQDATYATDIKPIFDKYCMALCHEAGGSGASTLLMDGDDLDVLVDVNAIEVPSMKLVAPGDTMNSYLWHKLDGTFLQVGGSGSKMPLGMMMTEDELATVEVWIANGAKP